MLSIDSRRVLEAAHHTIEAGNGTAPVTAGMKAAEQATLVALATATSLTGGIDVASSGGPAALEIPDSPPDLLAASSYGTVDISDRFKGQFAGVVIETWNNRPGETPKHVILDCAGVTDFGSRGDAANELRAELAPPNTLVVKVTQPLQGANIILERDAGLPPADRRVSPELIGEAILHGTEKTLREQLGDAGPSLVDRALPPVHLTGLSYATLAILSIAEKYNVG
ncbi:MAG: hypothetical protein AAF658_03970, partial [Myxococcota bacterium]